MGLKIAITMRTLANTDHSEICDGICVDWLSFLKSMFGNVLVFPLMNDKETACALLKTLQPDLVILSGGESLYESPNRDESEFALIDAALGLNMPIFAVCRGFQIINHYFGGRVTADLKKETGVSHSGIFHTVNIEKTFLPVCSEQDVLHVNSYHDQGVVAAHLAPSMEVFAMTDNDIVEGCFHKKKNIRAVQWHPERDHLLPDFHGKLLRDMVT